MSDRAGWGVKLWAGFVLSAFLLTNGWIYWQFARFIYAKTVGGVWP